MSIRVLENIRTLQGYTYGYIDRYLSLDNPIVFRAERTLNVETARTVCTFLCSPTFQIREFLYRETLPLSTEETRRLSFLSSNTTIRARRPRTDARLWAQNERVCTFVHARCFARIAGSRRFGTHRNRCSRHASSSSSLPCSLTPTRYQIDSTRDTGITTGPRIEFFTAVRCDETGSALDREGNVPPRKTNL